MSRTTTYDAIVIGTSQGDRFLPIALAKAGQKVALIERGHIGGTCVNVGCTPTKTMVASARVAYLARRGAEYGVHAGPIGCVAKTRKGPPRTELRCSSTVFRWPLRTVLR